MRLAASVSWRAGRSSSAGYFSLYYRGHMSRYWIASLLVLGMFVGARAEDAKKDKKWDKAPEMKIDVNKTYTATFETSKGKIVCELFPKEAPIAVNNFVFLSCQGLYDGLTCHRALKDFMIQGAHPNGD